MSTKCMQLSYRRLWVHTPGDLYPSPDNPRARATESSKVTVTTIDITRGKHMLLTTFRKSGAGVATPVWTVPVSDGRVGMWTGASTGKYKRLRNNPHVTIQPCTARGKTNPGAAILNGTAEIVQAGAFFDEVQASIRAKYGRLIPIVKRISRLQGRYKRGQSFGDTVVLISIAASGESRPAAPLG